MNSPLRFTLGGEIRKACYSIQNLTDRNNVNYWERDQEYATEMRAAAREFDRWSPSPPQNLLGGRRPRPPPRRLDPRLQE